MCFKVVGPITCCLLLSWGVLATPRKDDPSAGYYLPSKVGDKLVFEDANGDGSTEWVLEVTEARQKGAAVLVTVRVVQGDWTSEPWQHEVSDKGVYKVGEGNAVLESPECHLRLPFRKGETWEAAGKCWGETLVCKFTIAGEEEVEVPAGHFHCLRIESECEYKGVPWTATRWMAPRVGLVKEVIAETDKPPVLTTVLKSFAPGRK